MTSTDKNPPTAGTSRSMLAPRLAGLDEHSILVGHKTKITIAALCLSTN